MYLQSKWELIFLEKWKLLGRSYIAKLQNVSTRESAKLLMNNSLIIDATQLPVLNNGEYYYNDLIGCSVVTVRNDFLGYVVNIIETIANDVLVIKTNNRDSFINSRTSCLIPFLYEKVIKNIDLNTRTIIVDWDSDF